jgi:serine O-acetyltransferase
LLQPFLFFKGFHATQVQRVSHCLWKRGDFESRCTALALQSRISEIWAVDMHPGAVLGRGLFLDHAHAVVIGETAQIGERCTMLHGVTLGGTGKDNSGERRHPSIGDDCVIGAGSTILGDIRIGDRCVVGAQAVVTKDVDDDRTAVGLNRILEPEAKAEGVPFQAEEAMVSPDMPHPTEVEAPPKVADDWAMI